MGLGRDAAKSSGDMRLLWGSEALGLGLVESGIETLSVHESVKAAELALAAGAMRTNGRPSIETHLSPMRAVESAISAASQGKPAAVALPSRAFAAGATPLHTFSERGTEAGLVIIVFEDPGCEMTPGEIDSRYLARELYLPILEPGSLNEAREMAREVPQLSERWGQPVLLRVGLRLMDTRGLIDASPKKPEKKAKAQALPPAVASTPLGAYGGDAARTARISRLEAIRQAVETVPWNRVELTPPSDSVVIAVGAAWGPTRDALQLIGMEQTVQLVKIGTPYPLPRAQLAQTLRRARRALVIEELEPFVESRVSDIANKEGFQVSVRGKVFVSRGGELTTWDVAEALGRFAGLSPPIDDKRIELVDKIVAQALPPRPPTLPRGHGMRVACEAAAAFAGAKTREQVIVEAPPEWRVAMTSIVPHYFGDWGEGLGVGAAAARRKKGLMVVVTEGRGLVAGLSALREVEAEHLKIAVVVSPQGLSAAVDRALPGAQHHALDLKALAAALGLEGSAIIDVGKADVAAVAAAIGQAAEGSVWPRIITFSSKENGKVPA